MSKQIDIIGTGFSALAAACYLAKAGKQVIMYEKNNTPGGRARQLKHMGFTFDMGPTWYWMPDVFERFFNDFNTHPSDFYTLKKLDPGYKVYLNAEKQFSISANLEQIYALFEQEEPGSSRHLKSFLDQAKENYQIAVQDLVYKPGNSPFELVNAKTAARLQLLFKSIQKQIRAKIHNPNLWKLLEFPVLFLGAKPSNTPALYNFMNWADFGLGTWHPVGGMYKVVEAMIQLAQKLGVEIQTEQNVEKIITEKGQVKGLIINGVEKRSNIVLSGADYQFTESLLNKKDRMYSNKYWQSRTFAPSALLYFIAINKKLKNIAHHTLFFDADFEKHAEEIYGTPKWPENPLFYASFPSQTDASFAPKGQEAATILIPLAPDLEDTATLREKYLKMVVTRFEKLTGQEIEKDIIFTKSYCVNDFKKDYNAYKGNAYGLANILTQTAFLRPKIKSKKVKNLFFTGQLTVPGPGVPPSLISGKIAAHQILTNG